MARIVRLEVAVQVEDGADESTVSDVMGDIEGMIRAAIEECPWPACMNLLDDEHGTITDPIEGTIVRS